jgi:hypothetical protein
MSAEGRLNTKVDRMFEFRSKNPMSIEEMDSTGREKEELCFEYIRQFIHIFSGKYPNRKLPYILSENEYGECKFVCTNVRSNQLPYQELYDMFGCASYISGYIVYEPLDPQCEPPQVLASPSYTLASYTGDCFDIATLLCSLLLGSGFDAYVISGYAPPHITLKDQGSLECPALDQKREHENPKMASSMDDTGYEVIDNEVLDSEFLKEEKERKRRAELDTFVLWENKDLPPPPDKVSESRTHAWVLVKAGPREVDAHWFLEPSTGRAYTMANSPYLGVESVWNNENYWALNKVGGKVSQIDFDFENENNWTTLFLSTSVDLDSSMDNNDFKYAKHPVGSDLFQFEMPISVLPQLSLSRSSYLLCYPPNGMRSTLYFKAKLDRYAKYTHPQGTVMMLTRYLDKLRVIPKEIHEWFEGRKDKMYRRIRYILGQFTSGSVDLGQFKLVEYYHPGNEGEIKIWTEYPGKRLELDFYANGRLDRLMRREETFNVDVTEYFDGRVNRLESQLICFSTEEGIIQQMVTTTDPAGDSSSSEVINTTKIAAEKDDLCVDLFITKIVQHFARGPDANSGTDVAKKTFMVRELETMYQYHNPEGNIGLHVRTVVPERLSSVESFDKEKLSQREFEKAQKEKNAAIQEFREVSRKLRLVAISRRQSEMDVKQLRTVHEIALDNAAAGEVVAAYEKSETEGAETTKADYLTPYLRNAAFEPLDAANLSHSDAEFVKNNCYKAFESRMLERLKIIEDRLGKERTSMTRRQEAHQRRGGPEGEDYEKSNADSLFRIKVLEDRLEAHKAHVLKKCRELRNTLDFDPRLRGAPQKVIN